MSTELETKQDETKDVIKDEIKSKEDEKPAEVDKLKELELENARLQGMIDAKADTLSIKPIESESEQYQKNKQIVLSDAQALSNEEFEERYKMSKAEAKLGYTNYEFEKERIENKENLAILRAENEVVKKYGEKYSKYQDKIEAAIKDLAPSVRQDPKKLAQYIEITLRSYLFDDKSEPQPKPIKKENDPMNRKIVDSGFEKPNATADDVPLPTKKSDEIPEEFKPLATTFGLESEKERQKFKNDSGIDVAYGASKWFTKDGVKIVKS